MCSCWVSISFSFWHTFCHTFWHTCPSFRLGHVLRVPRSWPYYIYKKIIHTKKQCWVFKMKYMGYTNIVILYWDVSIWTFKHENTLPQPHNEQISNFHSSFVLVAHILEIQNSLKWYILLESMTLSIDKNLTSWHIGKRVHGREWKNITIGEIISFDHYYYYYHYFCHKPISLATYCPLWALYE